MATKNPSTTPTNEAEASAASGPTIEELQARVAELQQALMAESEQAEQLKSSLLARLEEVQELAAQRAREIETLLTDKHVLEAQLADARRIASPPPPAPPAGKLYRVISPLDHHGKRYMPDGEVHLTDEEAEPLLGHTVQPA